MSKTRKIAGCTIAAIPFIGMGIFCVVVGGWECLGFVVGFTAVIFGLVAGGVFIATGGD